MLSKTEYNVLKFMHFLILAGCLLKKIKITCIGPANLTICNLPYHLKKLYIAAIKKLYSNQPTKTSNQQPTTKSVNQTTVSHTTDNQ